MPEQSAPPTKKHRCLQCGQLKDESELYYGDQDWACVDPKHGGFNLHHLAPAEYSGSNLTENATRLTDLFPDGIEFLVSGNIVELLTEPRPQPVREDYRELTTAFAQILFEWKFTIPDSVDLESRNRLIRDYFQGGVGKDWGRAHHVLTALVAAALHGRERIGISIEDRQRQDARVQAETARAIREFGTPKTAELLELQQRANDSLNILVEHQRRSLGQITHCPFCNALLPLLAFSCTSCGKTLFPLEAPE